MSLFRFIVCVAWGVVLARPAAGEADALVDGLLQRRLFSLAEFHCREQLQQSDLSPAEQAQLTADLIRTYAQQALFVEDALRDPLWQQARAVGEDFRRRFPQHPRGLLVRFQTAAAILARGELRFQEAEVLADPAEDQAAAREALREAIRELESLEKDILGLLPERRRQTSPGIELTADELTHLHQLLRYELARAHLWQGLSYPALSADRLGALSLARQQLEAAVAQLATDDSRLPAFRLLQAQCYRQLADFESAEKVLAGLESLDLAATFQQQRIAELARLALARGRPREALNQLAQIRESERTEAPELALVQCDALLGLWREAVRSGPAQEAAVWRNRARELVALIEQRFGPFYGRQANWRLVRTSRELGDEGDYDILRRSAEAAASQGDPRRAVEQFDQAAGRARQAQRLPEYFSLAYQAALVLQEQRQFAEAGDRLQRLAVDQPQHGSAARAHLLAIWNHAQAARAAPGQLDRYGELLDEHLRRWPEAESAATARLWRGRWKYAQGDFASAAGDLVAVPQDRPEASEAAWMLSHCYTAWLLDGSPHDGIREAARQAAAQLDAILDAPPDRIDDSARRLAAFTAARLRLTLLDVADASCEEDLQIALAPREGEPGAAQVRPLPEGFAVEALAWLLVAQAAQADRQEAAEKTLAQIAALPPPAGRHLIGPLRQWPQPASVSSVSRMAEWRVRLAAVALSRPLPPELLWEVERLRAKSLVDAGRREEARAAYAKLAADHPDQGELQESYAEFLSAGEQPRDAQSALDQWRKVASRSTPRSARWYRSKLGIARALQQLGQETEAVKLIRYLDVTEGLDATGMREAFERVLQECRKKDGKDS